MGNSSGQPHRGEFDGVWSDQREFALELDRITQLLIVKTQSDNSLVDAYETASALNLTDIERPDEVCLVLASLGKISKHEQRIYHHLIAKKLPFNLEALTRVGWSEKCESRQRLIFLLDAFEQQGLLSTNDKWSFIIRIQYEPHDSSIVKAKFDEDLLEERLELWFDLHRQRIAQASLNDSLMPKTLARHTRFVEMLQESVEKSLHVGSPVNPRLRLILQRSLLNESSTRKWLVRLADYRLGKIDFLNGFLAALLEFAGPFLVSEGIIMCFDINVDPNQVSPIEKDALKLAGDHVRNFLECLASSVPKLSFLAFLGYKKQYGINPGPPPPGIPVDEVATFEAAYSLVLCVLALSINYNLLGIRELKHYLRRYPGFDVAKLVETKIQSIILAPISSKLHDHKKLGGIDFLIDYELSLENNEAQSQEFRSRWLPLMSLDFLCQFFGNSLQKRQSISSDSTSLDKYRRFVIDVLFKRMRFAFGDVCAATVGASPSKSVIKLIQHLSKEEYFLELWQEFLEMRDQDTVAGAEIKAACKAWLVSVVEFKDGGCCVM